MDLSRFDSLSKFQLYLELITREHFPDGVIPAGTFLYHGSRSATILSNRDTYEITYFGLEPSISVWKNIESLDEQVLLPEGVDACDELRTDEEVEVRPEYQSYVYVFRTTRDIQFTYIRDIECHPMNLQLDAICLHPQIAFHGSPDCFLEEDEPEGRYKYNMAFELTINNINLADNQYMEHADTIVISPEETIGLYRLKFEPNRETLPIIYDMFEHEEDDLNMMNDEFTEDIEDAGVIIDQLLDDGIDIYDDPDFTPDCDQYGLELSMLNLNL